MTRKASCTSPYVETEKKKRQPQDGTYTKYKLARDVTGWAADTT